MRHQRIRQGGNSGSSSFVWLLCWYFFRLRRCIGWGSRKLLLLRKEQRICVSSGLTAVVPAVLLGLRGSSGVGGSVSVTGGGSSGSVVEETVLLSAFITATAWVYKTWGRFYVHMDR
mmetsp:Transcript_43281/g.50681  ORF Transcript_43281/g.50681 Transcript_43281/m.50681 type:complete len:117 (+) Transcript_43281:1088-1438(+)